SNLAAVGTYTVRATREKIELYKNDNTIPSLSMNRDDLLRVRVRHCSSLPYVDVKCRYSTGEVTRGFRLKSFDESPDFINVFKFAKPDLKVFLLCGCKVANLIVTPIENHGQRWSVQECSCYSRIRKRKCLKRELFLLSLNRDSS
ncbi:hypothetical protein PFISCL1PPCAC_10911, partial [Pristionchus fissidentatus]